MSTAINRNVWIDYFRSFITVLVVAHHSSLAYTTFAYFDKYTYINSTSPVVDSSRWIGMDIFENFNDVFFMSLMFLISGLFVVKSIQRKSRKTFLIERLRRLGIPFIICVMLIIPVAYIPSYYLSHNGFQLSAFIKDYIGQEQWPVGPPWFIWLLLLFNIIAMLIPITFFTTVSNRLNTLAKKPFLFLLILFVIVCFSFIPISVWIGQYTWTGFGPFDFQVNRILLYFTFFVLGCSLGASKWEEYFFTDNKLLNRSWWFWLLLCLLCYGVIEWLTFLAPASINPYVTNTGTNWFLFDLFFVASCISSSFAFIAFSKQKVNQSHNILNNLSENAYGIYLIHYIFITWLQFALLNISIPVILKFMIVFFGALILSWSITNWIRKIWIVNNLI